MLDQIRRWTKRSEKLRDEISEYHRSKPGGLHAVCLQVSNQYHPHTWWVVGSPHQHVVDREYPPYLMLLLIVLLIVLLSVGWVKLNFRLCSPVQRSRCFTDRGYYVHPRKAAARLSQKHYMDVASGVGIKLRGGFDSINLAARSVYHHFVW